MHPTCQCVLSQKNLDDSDIYRARPLGPSNTGTVEVRKTNLPLWCFGAAARIAMAREVVPSACHHRETLFRYLRMRTLKVLIVPASGVL
jgi:hypothetical protein